MSESTVPFVWVVVFCLNSSFLFIYIDFLHWFVNSLYIFVQQIKIVKAQRRHYLIYSQRNDKTMIVATSMNAQYIWIKIGGNLLFPYAALFRSLFCTESVCFIIIILNYRFHSKSQLFEIKRKNENDVRIIKKKHIHQKLNYKRHKHNCWTLKMSETKMYR